MSKEFVDFLIDEETAKRILPKEGITRIKRGLTLPSFEEDPGSPCEECIVLACCTKNRCKLLDDWKEGAHLKTLIECWVNLGISIFSKMSNIEYPPKVHKSTGKPIKFMFFFKFLCRLLGFMVNCRSWENNTIYDFDRQEFKQRIKNLNLF